MEWVGSGLPCSDDQLTNCVLHQCRDSHQGALGVCGPTGSLRVKTWSVAVPPSFPTHHTLGFQGEGYPGDMRQKAHE